MVNTTTKYQPGDRFDHITFLTREPSKRADDTRWRVRCACGREETVYMSVLHKRRKRYKEAMCCACGNQDPINWDYYIPAFATLINQYRNK